MHNYIVFWKNQVLKNEFLVFYMIRTTMITKSPDNLYFYKS